MATAKKTAAKKVAAKTTAPTAAAKTTDKKKVVKDPGVVADKLVAAKKVAAKKTIDKASAVATDKKPVTAKKEPAKKKVAAKTPASTGLTGDASPPVAHVVSRNAKGETAVAVSAPITTAPVAAPAPTPAPKPARPVVTPPRFAPKPPPPPPAPPAPPPKPAISFEEATTSEMKKVNVKKFPLVPLFGDSTLSQNNFARPAPITVNMPDGSTQSVKSGFLAFNKSIELLALTSSNEWIEAGHVAADDHIGDDMKLLAICVELDGQNVFIQVNPDEHLFKPAVGNARFSVISTEISYSPDPSASPRRVFIIKVEGNVDLDTGRAYLSATANRPELAPMGFFLQGSRQSYVK